MSSYAVSACCWTAGRSCRVGSRRRSSGDANPTGAPLIGGTESSVVEVEKAEADGSLVIPINAHIRIGRTRLQPGRHRAAPPVLLLRRLRQGRCAGCRHADHPLAGRPAARLRAGAGPSGARRRAVAVLPARGERPVRGHGRGGKGRVRQRLLEGCAPGCARLRLPRTAQHGDPCGSYVCVLVKGCFRHTGPPRSVHRRVHGLAAVWCTGLLSTCSAHIVLPRRFCRVPHRSVRLAIMNSPLPPSSNVRALRR